MGQNLHATMMCNIKGTLMHRKPSGANVTFSDCTDVLTRHVNSLQNHVQNTQKELWTIIASHNTSDPSWWFNVTAVVLDAVAG